MPYPAKTIANYFIGKSITDPKKTFLTPIKTIKLTYIAHGFYLANLNKPLIDEYAVAWQYGPVIESLYKDLKKYGSDPITQLINNAPEIPADDEDARNYLNKIWDAYGDLHGMQLSTWTHQISSPWYNTWRGGKGKNDIISNEEIKKYFKNFLDEYKKAKNIKD